MLKQPRGRTGLLLPEPLVPMGESAFLLDEEEETITGPLSSVLPRDRMRKLRESCSTPGLKLEALPRRLPAGDRAANGSMPRPWPVATGEPAQADLLAKLVWMGLRDGQL